MSLENSEDLDVLSGKLKFFKKVPKRYEAHFFKSITFLELEFF
jgi:hypothetical protein